MRLPLSVVGLIAAASARQVNITVDASSVLGELPPTARFFGADEPNQGIFRASKSQEESRILTRSTATYPDGEKLIHDLGQLGPHQTYFRTHNLLTTCDPPNNTSPKRLKWGCKNQK
jgi:xylan 1,4-beta-xylosidase